MRVVMTLVVRDEADIADAQIAFHLAAGVDFVIATDHESQDGTTDVLERYAAQGVLHLIREAGDKLRQSEWVTRMAKMAKVDFDADWVINSDVDEFWWPWGGDLTQVLARIPERYGIVSTFVRPFLPRPGSAPFAEQMTVRFSPTAPINDPSSPFRPNVRIVHRGSADVVVSVGNAGVSDGRLVPLRGWSPIEVLHFPIRSYEQFERKFLTHYFTVGGRGDHARAYRASRAGRLREMYEQICVGEERLLCGLEAGTLVVDTRLREVFRELNASSSAALAFPPRNGRDEACYAVDAVVLDDGELARIHRRIDLLGQRLARLERRRRSTSSV